MIALNHGMTGALIALTVKNPLLAVPFSFVSHFAQDILPHWNYGVPRSAAKTGKFFTRRFNLTLLADGLLSIILLFSLSFFIFPQHKWLIWACMAAAASPDLMWAYYRLYLENIKKQKPKYDPLAKFHAAIQWSQTSGGFLVELAWFLATGAIILSLR